MVKAVAFFRRRAGLSVDDFQGYWLRKHPDVVTRLRGVRRYVQSHVRPVAYRLGDPPYDGIAEVWFDDTAAMHALRGTPEMAAVQADEARFIDHATMGLVITEDHVVKDGPVPRDAVKLVGFVKRASGTGLEEFRRQWRDVNGPLGAAMPAVRRYVQSLTRAAAYERGREPAWDGLALAWLDDATETPDVSALAPVPMPLLLTTEHVIVA